jgi:hypothetical protein
MNIKQLKRELTARGTDGLKPALAERLEHARKQEITEEEIPISNNAFHSIYRQRLEPK